MSPQRAQSLHPKVRADGTCLGHVPLEVHLSVWGVVCFWTSLLVEGCLSVWESLPTSKHFFSSGTVSFLSQKRRVTPPSIFPHGALSPCRPREAWASGISPQGALALLDGAQAIWHFSSQNTVSLSEMKTLPPSLSPQSTLCLRCYLSVCLSVIRHFSSWRAVYLRKHADQKTFLLFQRCISIAASSLAFHIMENYLPVWERELDICLFFSEPFLWLKKRLTFKISPHKELSLFLIRVLSLCLSWRRSPIRHFSSESFISLSRKWAGNGSSEGASLSEVEGWLTSVSPPRV